MSLFKGVMHLLGLQKNEKDLINNAPWTGTYDRSKEDKYLLSKEPVDYNNKKDPK